MAASPAPVAAASGAPAELDRAFFGHPRGLSTLFFTEMWERFSYYGMRALLILFMTAARRGGRHGARHANRGGHLRAVHVDGVPGQHARRLDRRSVDRPAACRAVRRHPHRTGNAGLAIPTVASFYAGLTLIVFGTGLLKPNVSAIVGQLYGPKDTRRDAGFSIFYMGINLGAGTAPLVSGWLGQRVDWHLGFAAASVGMTLGVIQVRVGKPRARYGGAGACTSRVAGGVRTAPPARIHHRRSRPPALRGRRTGHLDGDSSDYAESGGHCGRLSAAHHRRPLLRVVVLWRIVDTGGAETPLRDRLFFPGGDPLLVGVRTGRVDAQSLRRAEYAQSHRGLRISEQLVSGAQLRVPLDIRADLRVALDHAGARANRRARSSSRSVSSWSASALRFWFRRPR